MSEAEIKRIDPAMVPAFQADVITPADLAALYELMAVPLPEDGLEETKGAQTRKGYDTLNWGYQYYLNRLNETVGPAHYVILEGIVAENQVQMGNPPKPAWEICMDVTVEIGNFIDGKWVPIARRSGYGGHTSFTKVDALKGAKTNGFKKATSGYGIGRQAYEGSLDDDTKDEDGKDAGQKRYQRGQNQGQQGQRTAGAGLPTPNGGQQAQAQAQTQSQQAQGQAQTQGQQAQGQAQNGNTDQTITVTITEIAAAEAEAKTAPYTGKKYLMVKGTAGDNNVSLLAFEDDPKNVAKSLKPGDELAIKVKGLGPNRFEFLGKSA